MTVEEKLQAKRFLDNYRCECYTHNYCNCPQKAETNALFIENIRDVARALHDIMIVCGIHEAKANSAFDVIINCFLFYDEIRHRIDAVPRKRFSKEDLMHQLGRKCLMSRMEAQLSYSMIKRAFKAFYHGTCEGGIRNPALEAQLIHSQECLWVHAAKRTAQIFAAYEGLFFSSQHFYQQKISCIYKKLYDRLRTRAKSIDMQECDCKRCIKRMMVNLPRRQRSLFTLKTLKATTELERMHEELVKAMQKRHGIERTTADKVERCDQCKCARLLCDCKVDTQTGVLSAECSQGPFDCRWIKLEDDDTVDRRIAQCMELPQDHECPVDCTDLGPICLSDCECDCEDICECSMDESSSDNFEDMSLNDEAEDFGEVRTYMNSGLNVEGMRNSMKTSTEELGLSETEREGGSRVSPLYDNLKLSFP